MSNESIPIFKDSDHTVTVSTVRDLDVRLCEETTSPSGVRAVTTDGGRTSPTDGVKGPPSIVLTRLPPTVRVSVGTKGGEDLTAGADDVNRDGSYLTASVLTIGGSCKT